LTEKHFVLRTSANMAFASIGTACTQYMKNGAKIPLKGRGQDLGLYSMDKLDLIN